VRIALLTEIPAPFRIPLFNALAARDDADALVLFLSERDPRRPHYRVYEREFRFPWQVLPGRELQRGARWLVLSRGAGRELRAFRPDVVVVGGWNQPAFWTARRHSRRRRIPLVAWVESTLRDERPGSRPLEAAKRAFVRSCAGFLVPGRASAEYVRSLGVAGEIAIAPNAVDPDIFGRRVEELRAGRDRLRAERGLHRCTFLYVGRLDPEKDLETLFRALRDLPADLAVIGGGTDEARLRGLAPPSVRFVGRLERDELPAWYAAADAFVLPSRSEQWGMVLNEAALAGLPLVATDAAGAAHELIEDGVNGFRVPAGDEAALAAALERLVRDDAFRAEAGERSREIGRRFTPEAWAEAVVGIARSLVR
jgi:glycosyltransferase involved in cell wall biosynthesis